MRTRTGAKTPEQTGTRYKAAVIGLGRIGQLLEDDPLREHPCTHAGAIAASPRTELVGGIDIDVERRREFRARWQTPAWADIDDLFAHETPDIVHIATPPETHRAIFTSVARHKPRIVVCEKPLATTLEDAEAMLRLARETGIATIVNHERRFSFEYAAVRRRLAAGRFGPPLSATARLYFGQTRAPSTMLLDDGTHLLDILRFLFAADITVVNCTGEDTPGASLFLDLDLGGVPVRLEAGSGRDHLVFEIDISCARGRIRIGNGTCEAWRSRPSPYASGYRSLELVHALVLTRTQMWRRMLEHAVFLADNPGARSQSGFDDGCAVLGAIEACRKCLPPKDA